MALETCNANLSANLVRCGQCNALRTHSTQAGYELPAGSIEWREEINGCAKHPAVAVIHKLDGTIKEWTCPSET
jgi:hypothetical protein